MKTFARLLVHLAGPRRTRARIYIKADETPWAGSTELACRIWPAGQTLSTLKVKALTISKSS